MELTKGQIKAINSSLERGQKTVLAERLGIHQAALSRYLSVQLRRDRVTGRMVKKYIMPTYIYNGIVDFINER